MKGTWYLLDGQTVRLLMQVQGLNQKELVKKSGVCRSNISACENHRPVSDFTLNKLARAFDVEPSSLIWRTLDDDTTIYQQKGSFYTY